MERKDKTQKFYELFIKFLNKQFNNYYNTKETINDFTIDHSSKSKDYAFKIKSQKLSSTE